MTIICISPILFVADRGNFRPEPVIVRAARALDERHAKSSQVGIQFVQVGGDAKAKEFLESLDDNLKREHNVRVCSSTNPKNDRFYFILEFTGYGRYDAVESWANPGYRESSNGCYKSTGRFQGIGSVRDW